MNLEALLVIGTIALLAGGILYIPFHLWFKWKRSKEPPSHDGRLSGQITKLGVKYYSSMVICLFVGLAQERLAPDSAFGRFISTFWGQIAYLISLVAIWTVLAVVFRKRGQNIMDTNNPDV